MTSLAEHLDRYLAVRRAVGYSLAEAGHLLGSFVTQLEADGGSTVTVEAALVWANTAATAGGVARRLTMVRGFARYLVAFEPATEIPPPHLGPRIGDRPRPHLYSDDETTALMTAARGLRPDVLAATFVTLIGLLAATGLRPGEAFGLQNTDVDLEVGQLAVVHSKAGRSRLIPLHASTVDALAHYRQVRDTSTPRHSTAFFVTGTGAPLRAAFAATTFRRLRTAASVTAAPGERPARFYDYADLRVMPTSA